MNADVSDKISKFFTTYPRRTYPAGHIVVFADESPEHVFYIESGKVRKYDTSYKGDEVIVNVFKPPAFFPMSWAINRADNHFFYKTEEPTVLYVAPPEDTMRFLQRNPDVMLDLLSRVYHGLEGLLGRMVHLMSGTAKSRLMYELIIECRRFGVEQDGGCVLVRAGEQDIAARTGLSRETVSREMKKLKECGLVVMNKQGITVTDLDALERAIGAHI